MFARSVTEFGAVRFATDGGIPARPWRTMHKRCGSASVSRSIPAVLGERLVLSRLGAPLAVAMGERIRCPGRWSCRRMRHGRGWKDWTGLAYGSAGAT